MTKIERDAAAAASVLNQIGWHDEFIHFPPGMNESAPARFWSKVKIEGDHWLWARTIAKDGSGKFTPAPGYCYPAHRVAWMMMRGDLASELALVHHDGCEFRHCVNPDHRRAVTATEARRIGGLTKAKAGGQPIKCSQRMVATLEALHAAGQNIWPACQHLGLGQAAMHQIQQGNAVGADM